MDGSSTSARLPVRAGRRALPGADEPRRHRGDRRHRPRRRARQGRPHLQRAPTRSTRRSSPPTARVRRPARPRARQPRRLLRRDLRAGADPAHRPARRHARRARHHRSRAHTRPGHRRAARSGSTTSPAPPTGPCSCSATTTCGAPDSSAAARDLLRHPPRRLRAARRRRRPPPRHPRLLRRPHPPQPRPPHPQHRRPAVGRGGVREGLPGHVGRVPRVRRRRPPGAPPHLHARGAGVDRADPRHVRGHLRRRTRSAASTTAASRCVP